MTHTPRRSGTDLAAPETAVAVRPPTVGPDDSDRGLMEQIFGQSPVGIAVIDFEGRYQSVNPAYCATYGYPSEDLLGHSFLMVLAPARREQMLALHQAFLTTGGELRGEWEVVRSDGTPLHVIIESVRVPGDDGRGRRLVYVVDITQRKLMEQALDESQSFLQELIDGLTAHICVLDGTGTVVAVNRSWRDFASANAGQAECVHEGASYLQVCERAASAPGPDGQDAERFLGLLRDVLGGRRQQFQFEYPCHSPTEQRWFVARVARIEGSDPPRVGVAHDSVTALKLVQEAVRQREAALQDLAASIPGALFRMAHDESGGWRFVYVSSGIEALIGITAAQACLDINAVQGCVLPEDLAAYDASLRAASARDGVWEHEFRVLPRDGQVKWIHTRAQPGQADQGDPIWTGVLTDVTERKRIEALLQTSEATYRTLFETAPQGVMYHDLHGRITSANPAALRMLGLSPDQLLGRTPTNPHWDVIHEDGSVFPGDQHPALQVLSGSQPSAEAVMGVNVPGQDRVWIALHATPLFTEGRIDQAYASFEDITQRVRLTQELARQATTDFLTGAANRRKLMDCLGTEFERIRRHPSLQCGVLAIDLDLFKAVNDRWGHHAGDAVLVSVTQMMRQETRSLDLVSRTGGEEFIVLLPDTGAEAAVALAERLRRRVEVTPVRHGPQTIAISVSIGVSVITAADTQVDAVLVRVDRALYEAKSAGRNTVRLSSA